MFVCAFRFAKFTILTFIIVTAISFTAKAQNFGASELLLEQSWFFPVMCVVLRAESMGKKFFFESELKTFDSPCLAFHSILLSCWEGTFQIIFF